MTEPTFSSGPTSADTRADTSSGLSEVELAWTTRRLELERALDAAVQQALAGVFQIAGEVRSSMEADARSLLERLRQERAQLVSDVRHYGAERDRLLLEVEQTRQRAEDEARRLRQDAAAEATELLARAEARRAELMVEIERLEVQLADVSHGIQALLQEQVGRVRVGTGETDVGRSVAPTAPASAPTPEPHRSTVEDRPIIPDLPPPGPDVPPRSAGVTAAERQRLTGWEATPPVPASLIPPSDAEGVVEEAPPTSASTAPVPEQEQAAAPQRVELVIANTPSFARALELQRGIQRTAGVRHVQALQFDRGRLVLAVEHDAGVDVATEVARLPNVTLELIGQTDERVEFSFTSGG